MHEDAIAKNERGWPSYPRNATSGACSGLNPLFCLHSVNNKYFIVEKLGKGRFGEVFRGQNKYTNEYVAIKQEILPPNTNPTIPPSRESNRPTRAPSSGAFTLNILKHETRVLNYLCNKKCKRIPQIYWYGIYFNTPTLVMPFYEYSLYDLYTKSKPKCAKLIQEACYTHGIAKPDRMHAGDVPATTMNALPVNISHFRTILQVLREIHECGVVHRDIKPHNFMVKGGELFLIDFGMASFYVDGYFEHISENPLPKEHLLGTQKYISYNIHLGKEYTRRDDLISAGYLYMFMTGQLFWDKIYYPLDSDIPYSETHIMHPKNQCYKSAKTLAQIEKCFIESRETSDCERTAECANTYASSSLRCLNIHRRGCILAGECNPSLVNIQKDPLWNYLQYVYGLSFSETPNYDILDKYIRNVVQ